MGDDPITRDTCNDRMVALERLILVELRSLQTLMTQRFDSAAEELKLQAGEYQRRLGELNQAHERADKARAETVSREAYGVHVKEADLRHLETTRQLTIIQTRAVTWAAAWGIFATLIAFALHFV